MSVYQILYFFHYRTATHMPHTPRIVRQIPSLGTRFFRSPRGAIPRSFNRNLVDLDSQGIGHAIAIIEIHANLGDIKNVSIRPALLSLFQDVEPFPAGSCTQSPALFGDTRTPVLNLSTIW